MASLLPVSAVPGVAEPPRADPKKWAGTVDSNTVSFDFQGSFNGTFTQFTLGTLTGVTLFYYNTVLSINPEVQTPEALTPVSLYANFTEGLVSPFPAG